MDVDQLTDRARALAHAGSRRILGIAGAPGAGKSTLAALVTAASVVDGGRFERT